MILNPREYVHPKSSEIDLSKTLEFSICCYLMAIDPQFCYSGQYACNEKFTAKDIDSRPRGFLVPFYDIEDHRYVLRRSVELGLELAVLAERVIGYHSQQMWYNGTEFRGIDFFPFHSDRWMEPGLRLSHLTSCFFHYYKKNSARFTGGNVDMVEKAEGIVFKQLEKIDNRK